ncbi:MULTISPECIES: PIN domain-containing protein [unclassified Microcoleus]|uniref:PIN domain-containing protein n=1 Tax=unclassified Microcoleus TaxID=2642155 RepID=UPI002FD1C665
MSIATGRDPQASTLLRQTPASVQLTIPSICYMESFSALEDEVKRHNYFKQQLDNQISEANRDLTSQHAQSLFLNLGQSRTDYERRLDDIDLRLRESIEQLSQNAEMIALTANMIQQSLNTIIIKKDPTDNLILHCILIHARLHPTETKVFLSGNVREFRKLPEVQDALQQAGVTKYFSRTEDFIGWLQSQS